MKRLEERYLRWVFRLDRRTRVFDKRRDTERKIERKGGKKSMGVRKKIGIGGSEWTRKCWQELAWKKRAKSGRMESRWEEEKGFFEERGWDIREIEKRREEKDVVFEEVIEKDRNAKIREVAKDKRIEV